MPAPLYPAPLRISPLALALFTALSAKAQQVADAPLERVVVILRADRWNELDPGARANSAIYPLHTGELGGLAMETVNALLGMALASLGVLGLWLWLWLWGLRRRR